MTDSQPTSWDRSGQITCQSSALRRVELCNIHAKRYWLLFWPLDYGTKRKRKSVRTGTWSHCECDMLDVHRQKSRGNNWVTDVHIQILFCMYKVCNYIHFSCILYPNWLLYHQTSQIRWLIFQIFIDIILPSKLSVIWGSWYLFLLTGITGFSTCFV